MSSSLISPALDCRLRQSSDRRRSRRSTRATPGGSELYRRPTGRRYAFTCDSGSPVSVDRQLRQPVQPALRNPSSICAWSSGRIHGTRPQTFVSNAAMCLQPRERSLLVGADEPAVARDVRGERRPACVRRVRWAKGRSPTAGPKRLSALRLILTVNASPDIPFWGCRTCILTTEQTADVIAYILGLRD